MPGPVRAATRADTGPLAASLARAFFDDPVMSFLLPDDPTRRRRSRRILRGRPGHPAPPPRGACFTDTDRAGGALWDPPGHWKMGWGQIARGSPKLVRSFGINVPRALRVLSTIERQHPTVPHWYLAVLGTDPIHQGKGIGSSLLAPILERCDADGVGAYLESSKESNIAFYGRHGFEVTGEIVSARWAPGVAHVARPAPTRKLRGRRQSGAGGARPTVTAARKASGASSIG